MIKKTASGRYTVRIYFKGSQVTMRTFERKKDAESWELEQKRQLQRGGWVDPSAADIPLGALIDRFNNMRRGGVADHTWDTDESNFRIHVSEELKRQPVSLITPSVLDALFADLMRIRARATVARARDSMSSLFAWAEHEGVVAHNPVKKTKVPKGDGQEEDRVRPFTDAELDRVIAAAMGISKHHAELIEFLALTGLRWGEAAALRLSAVVQVPYPALIITRSKSTGYAEKTTKSGRTRRVPLSDRAAEIVATRSADRNTNDLVFVAPRGGQLNGRNFTRDVKWELFSDGHRIHDLRHTAATLWLQAGIDIKTVSTWLGHSDTAVTLRVYVHWMGADSDVAAMARLREVGRQKAATITPISRAAG